MELRIDAHGRHECGRFLLLAGECERPGESSGWTVAEASSGWTVGVLDETLKNEDEPLLCVAPNVGPALRHPMVSRAVPSPSPSHCACFRSSWSRLCGPYPYPCDSCQRRASTPCERSAFSCLRSLRSLLTLARDAFSGMVSGSRAGPVAMRCQSRVYAVEPGLDFPVLHLLTV